MHRNSLKIHRCPHFCTPYIPPLTHSITMFSLVHSLQYCIQSVRYSVFNVAFCVYMQLQTLDSNFKSSMHCWDAGWLGRPARPGHLLSLPPWLSLHDSHHSAQQSARCIPAACSSSLSPRTLGGGRRPRLTE